MNVARPKYFHSHLKKPAGWKPVLLSISSIIISRAAFHWLQRMILLEWFSYLFHTIKVFEAKLLLKIQPSFKLRFSLKLFTSWSLILSFNRNLNVVDPGHLSECCCRCSQRKRTQASCSVYCLFCRCFQTNQIIFLK